MKLKNDPYVQFIHFNGLTSRDLTFLTSSISSRLTLGDNALIRACLFDVLLATDSLPLVAPWDKSFLLFSFSTRDISPLWVKTNNLVIEQIIESIKLPKSSRYIITHYKIPREKIVYIAQYWFSYVKVFACPTRYITTTNKALSSYRLDSGFPENFRNFFLLRATMWSWRTTKKLLIGDTHFLLTW